MKNQWLMINQLDKQLQEWQTISRKYGKPRAGWIKTLREALCMSGAQLANRLGLTRGRINQLENAEVHDAVTLRALKEAANALECELIYAIVPKGNSTLESIIKTRAQQVAKERVARVAHSMSLEAQSVDADILNFQENILAKNLTENWIKKLWETPGAFDLLAEKLIQMQKEKKMNELDSLDKIKDPKFVNALKNALIRHQKLIATLKKKK